MSDFSAIFPELLLTAVACVLFLLGCSKRIAARRFAPLLALLGLAGALAIEVFGHFDNGGPGRAIYHTAISNYIRVLALAVGVMLLLLSWPTDAQATGNSALAYGMDASGEYFALFLLSITGLLLTTTANDLIMLFLALELTSIPTYVMVSISRPRPIAQEAGVKYFFLGALSVAIMLFGFSYLFGATGQIRFEAIARALHHPVLTRWELLGVVLCIIGFAYKMAAFPLHYYAGDVYEGAATPVTAFLAFVPKTAGFIALIKLLTVVGGEKFASLPPTIVTLLWVIAALTMTAGNVLGLLQSNVKRVLAYSSIAHSGYMLVGVTALSAQPADALQGVLFYLAAYGIMNSAAFGILMLLPGRPRLLEKELLPGDLAAETFDDIAGQGRSHLGLGLGMAVACFSLIGIPLTVGFVGKLLLIKPALEAGAIWLTVILVINAAISAAYYLRIVGTMFLRPEMTTEAASPATAGNRLVRGQFAVVTAVAISVLGTLVFGVVPRAAQRLAEHAAAGPVIGPSASSGEADSVASR